MITHDRVGGTPGCTGSRGEGGMGGQFEPGSSGGSIFGCFVDVFVFPGSG